MKRNIILFAIAMIAMIAFAGSAQALAEPVGGTVDKTDAEGQIITLWVNDRWWDNMTVPITDVPGYNDAYAFEDLTPLLTSAGVGSGDMYNLTVAMYCDGSNTYHNETGTHLYSIVYDGNPKYPPILNLELCTAPSYPDLVVSNVYPQYIFTDLTNVLSVNVTNQGTASAGSCDVNLTITHTGGPTVLTGSVPALNAGDSAVVEVGNWKPTVLETISMTASADSGGVVDEGANEGNNDLTVSRTTTGDCAVDDMLPDTCFGYRGDNPMTTAYEGTGGVIYSVGDFKYKNNTVSFTIGASGDENQVDGLTAEVPTGATIKNATLYVYYTYRKSATGPNPGADPRPDYEMSINGGSTLTTDEYYTDIKGFTTSEYQYGTLVYDVTANVAGDGAYQAVRSNYVAGKGYVSGMALMIIYDDGSDDTYSIAHGYDRLATYYKTQYKVVPEDATTTATLTDVDPTTIAEANLFTVTVDAVAPGSESQQFNSRSWEVGAWNCVAGVPTCNYNYPLGINRGAVDTSDITASGTDEVVKFQERISNGFAPLFACLQTTPPSTFVEMDEDNYNMSTPGTMVAPIMLRNIENYGTGTITVSYNSSVVHVTGVADGPFSTVYASNFNNIAGTVNISALNNDGYSGDIEFARITFEAVGGDADTTQLTLSVDKLADKDYNNLAYLIYDGSITLKEGVPPEISNEGADAERIIQTISSRARPPVRAISTLSVDVADPGSGVASVIIDLSPIGGGETTSMSGGVTYSVNTDATIGINLVHNLVVTATDINGNEATSTITLEVLRRGDVARNNNVDMGDALYIARQTVGLELPAENWVLVGDVVGEAGSALGDNLVDMADALYISRHTVGLEDEP